MIQKIKDLMTIKEEIDIIKNNLVYSTNSMSELKTEIDSLKNEISGIDNKNNEFFKNFEENIDLMKNIRHDFEKELFQFKLLKTQMQKKILEKFEEEMSKELKLQMQDLKTDGEAYNELKENLSKTSERVNQLSEQVDKFISISSNIKKEDFELTKFAKQLVEMDREKLELMNKINTLERLVSKMRRQEYATR